MLLGLDVTLANPVFKPRPKPGFQLGDSGLAGRRGEPCGFRQESLKSLQPFGPIGEEPREDRSRFAHRHLTERPVEIVITHPPRVVVKRSSEHIGISGEANPEASARSARERSRQKASNRLRPRPTAVSAKFQIDAQCGSMIVGLRMAGARPVGYRPQTPG